MKFFLDENFPKKAIDILKKAGHEILDIRGTEFEGCSDRVIFENAQQNRAVFLTTDCDFYHTIPSLYNRHCGIIVIALSQPNAGSIITKLKIALQYSHNINLNSSVLLITDTKMYLHRK